MGTLSAAPIFPSLIDEGADGGGYDVKLELPGLPIFIQFKRSECIKIASGREIKRGANLLLPYYRFAVTASSDSNQHEMLLAWDVHPNEVFYAAPMFHTKPEFDHAFLNGEVRQRSFFVRPRDIGRFSDEKAHHVSFDGTKCYRLSEPVEIPATGVAELERHFRATLEKEERSLRDQLPAILDSARAVRSKIREREADQRLGDIPTPSTRLLTGSGPGSSSTGLASGMSGDVREVSQAATRADQFIQRQRGAIPPVPRSPVAADDPRGQLAELADISIRDFNAQLYILQIPDVITIPDWPDNT